jgi:hypothetical protein
MDVSGENKKRKFLNLVKSVKIIELSTISEYEEYCYLELDAV